jgi:Arc/MetJ-type ribon-helix-helix transcriptional regulator
LDTSPDVHIRFPRRLYESINELVVKGGHYRSAPEFILECTRQELSEIKKNRIDERKIKVYWHNFRQEQVKMKEV